MQILLPKLCNVTANLRKSGIVESIVDTAAYLGGTWYAASHSACQTFLTCNTCTNAVHSKTLRRTGIILIIPLFRCKTEIFDGTMKCHFLLTARPCYTQNQLCCFPAIWFREMQVNLSFLKLEDEPIIKNTSKFRYCMVPAHWVRVIRFNVISVVFRKSGMVRFSVAWSARNNWSGMSDGNIRRLGCPYLNIF